MKLNNNDRSLWIDNDEHLYLWWKSTKLNKKAFIKEHRKEIDTYINKQLNRQ